MPPSTFRPPEVEFLKQYIVEWNQSKLGAKRKRVRGEVAPRTRLIHRVIEEFYVAFPECDINQTDENSLTFDSDTRSILHKRIRTWFTNHQASEDKAPDVVQVHTTGSTITARMLIMKRFSQDIGAIAQRVRCEEPSLGIMAARNVATTEFCKLMRQERPDELHELEELALKIRQHGAIDYADQPDAVLEQLMKQFPAKMWHEVHSWGNAMPVHIICLAAMQPPGETGLKTFLALTKSLNHLNDSEVAEKIRDLFLDALEDAYGGKPPGRPDTAVKAVYPDPNGTSRPMIPQVDDVKSLPRTTLREWLRVYLNYLWRWLGGKGSVPWKKLKGALRGLYLDPSRLPAGITTLLDPHRMNRDQLEALYLHILAGQLGKLRESHIIQFRRVDVSGTETPLTYESFCRDQPACSKVKYAPEEKLYALRVAKGLDEPSAKSDWDGLPLARLYSLYEPFDESTKSKLVQICPGDLPFARILELIDEMETLGPIHTVDQSSSEILNAHFPEDLANTDIRSLIGSKLLPPALFDASDPDHDAIALPTLIVWLRSPNRFIHSPSGTLRGGPRGVRFVVAVTARILATLLIAEHPTELTVEMRRVINPSILEQLSLQLHRLCSWLVDQLVQTNAILLRTFPQRSQAWKHAVVSAYLKNSLFNPTDSTPVALNVTSGVPLDLAELRACYDALMESDPDYTLGSANDIDPVPPRQPALRPRVVQPHVVHPFDSSDDSDSKEYIEIPEEDLQSTDSKDDLHEKSVQSLISGNAGIHLQLEDQIDAALNSITSAPKNPDDSKEYS
ncbi:hypothetical protein FRC08_005695 [Ceratobasidium sp. 394]|nr:hypothetical protein FRC08_005695 [Ceratobasidium sp. 394]